MQHSFYQQDRRKARARLLAFVVALLFCLTAIFPTAALAEEEDTNAMIRSYDAGKWGSLTLNLSYTKEKDQPGLPLDGAEIRIVRIADLVMTDKGPNYVLREGLGDLHLNFLSMSAGGLRQAASKIADYLKANPDVLTALEKETNSKVSPAPDETTPKAVRTATSDAQGKVFFDRLIHGIYLITQEGRTGTAKDYAPLSPVLCFMPEYLNADGKGTWIYDVVANPKYSPDKPSTPTNPPEPPTPETPTPKPSKPTTPKKPTPKPPYTGDMIHMGLWIGMVVIALIALIVVRRKNRKK